MREHVANLLGASSSEQTPLPSDILEIATAAYRRGYCPDDELFQAQKRVADVIRNALPDVLILSGKGKSLSRRSRGRASLVLLPKAVLLRQENHFVGTYAFTFGFWRKRFLFLTANEPGGVSTHLHERIVQRSGAAFSSMAEAQNSFADLWPILVEVGQRRRLAGLRAEVGDFVSPWADGLLFGDFARFDFDAETMKLAAPVLFDYDPTKRIFYRHELQDPYRNGSERLGYILRTYIGPAELKPHQVELHSNLLTFAATHRRAIEHFKNVWRIGVGSSDGAGEALAEMLGTVTPSTREIDDAVAALDRLSSSDLWLAEVARSRENRKRATASRDDAQK